MLAPEPWHDTQRRANTREMSRDQVSLVVITSCAASGVEIAAHKTARRHNRLMRAFALAPGILAFCTLLLALDPQDLFNRTRKNVLANLDQTPRYTCIETITREVRRTVRPREACTPTLVNAAANAYGEVLWHDRLRLDIAVINGSETFSWAGARQFETEDVNKLVGGGATGTGDFSGFLSSVFGTDAQHFRYTGEEDTPAGLMARFEFEVPLSTTHYRYSTHGRFKPAPYAGWFLIDPATASLRHLAVVATQFDPEDEVCRVEDGIDYQTAKIGDSDFVLPRESFMNAVYTRGTQARNTTEYSSCHEYSASSTIRFDDAEEPAASPEQVAAAHVPVPLGVDVTVALDTPIDSATAAAGDEITARALMDAKHSGAVVIHRGDRFHGRIVKLEQYLGEQAHWNLAIRFGSVVRGGVETPVSLEPIDDGIRVGPQLIGRGRFSGAALRDDVSRERPPGSGFFVYFGSGKLSLDSRFHSRWVTVAPSGGLRKDGGEELPLAPPQ